MDAVDTNILIYAANSDSDFHGPCLDYLQQRRIESTPTYLTWGICYEFLRVSTHSKSHSRPWSAESAWGFLAALLESPGIGLLSPTHRHAAVLAQTLAELPDIRGNLFHALHIAVLLREHGIGRICTRDTDFHRFPFLTVIDPLR